MSIICDDGGQELLYDGMPITDVIKEDMGVGVSSQSSRVQKKVNLYFK